MIDIEEATLSSFLSHVKKKTAHVNQSFFYSFTKEIEPVRLLDIYNHYQHQGVNRYFWSNHQEDFCLLGIDEAHEMTCNEGDMEKVQEAWKILLDDALEYNPYELAGTGITAMGGMAFDPLGQAHAMWHHYPSVKFIIPKYMLALTNDRYFLTINGYLSEHTLISDVLEMTGTFEKQLYHVEAAAVTVPQKVIEKEELKAEEWKALVQKAVDEIKANQAKKIVLARELKVRLNKQADIGNMLKRLRQTQPNSYVFAYESGDNCFIGATPERLVQMKGKELLSTCLAGTAPRGETALADKALADDLLHDDKNLEEHGYVVRMIKENIELHCKHIDIPDKPVIYPLQNLQHLYTPVKATLKNNHDVFDIMKQLHPTPALGGVPREKALQFIREEEFMDRGWYGAPVGWLDSSMHSEFAVAIRSGLTHKDEVTLFAGCGVMRDSDPEMEFEETKVKFLPMLNVLEDEDEAY